VRDKDGYFFILGRTDDVINVAGHRLGTREIEEASPATPISPKWPWWVWPMPSRARWPWLLPWSRTPAALVDDAARAKLEAEVMKVVDNTIGAVGARRACVL
jgi:propionyl-CoA synthetase